MRYLHQMWQSDRYWTIRKETLVWNINFDKIQDGRLAKVFTLWVPIDLRAHSRSLVFFVVDSVCLCVCLFVTMLLQIDSSFLFLYGIEPFRHLVISSSLHVAHYETKFFDFWFRPPNAQNLLHKICNCTKSPISRLVWQIDRRCLHLPGGFRGWPIHWNHAKCYGADLVAMTTTFGLGTEILSPTGFLALFMCMLNYCLE